MTPDTECTALLEAVEFWLVPVFGALLAAIGVLWRAWASARTEIKAAREDHIRELQALAELERERRDRHEHQNADP